MPNVDSSIYDSSTTKDLKKYFSVYNCAHVDTSTMKYLNKRFSVYNCAHVDSSTTKDLRNVSVYIIVPM